jgi:hypothetical protein
MTNHQEAIAIHKEEQDLEDDIQFCYYEEDGIKCIAETETDDQCENCGSHFCQYHGDRNCRLSPGEYVSTCETCYHDYYQPAMVGYWRATGINPALAMRR